MKCRNQDVLDLGKKINEKILDAYKSLKEHNFHRAYSPGLYDVIYFIMKNGTFKYRCINENWTPGHSKTNVIDCINEKGISHRAESCYEPFFGPWYKNIITLNIYEKRNKIVEIIKNDKNKRFTSLDKFFLYCADRYFDDKESIGDSLKLLADLPSNIRRAYEDWKNAEKPYVNPLIQQINRKLDDYDKSVDLIQLYKESPEYFLEKLNQMPQDELEKVINKLINNTNFQFNKEIDDKISEEYGDLIAKVFRKNVK